MRRRWSLAALLAALSVVLAACGGLSSNDDNSGVGPAGGPSKPAVRLGVVDFTEQLVLTQLYGQVLKQAGYQVTYQKLASRELADPALFNGQLDMLIEYAGSQLTYLKGLKGTPTSDDQKVLADLKTALGPKGVTALEQAPMSDQQAITITQATSDKYSVTTLSDLAKVSSQLVFGGPPECKDRDTCYKGMQETYNANFKSFKSLDQGSIRYQALLDNQIQVALSFSTDGIIARQNLVVVEDDKKLFPPDHAVPVARNDFLSKAGDEFTTTVNKVSAAITTEDVTALNAKVDIDQEDAGTVATEWLRQKGLLS